MKTRINPVAQSALEEKGPHIGRLIHIVKNGSEDPRLLRSKFRSVAKACGWNVEVSPDELHLQIESEFGTCTVPNKGRIYVGSEHEDLNSMAKKTYAALGGDPNFRYDKL